MRSRSIQRLIIVCALIWAVTAVAAPGSAGTTPGSRSAMRRALPVAVVTSVLSAPGVLGNDNDADGTQSSLTAVLVAAPTNAADFTLNTDGSFSYTPLPDFMGTDTFVYRVSDGTNESNEAAVMISVVGMGSAPLAANDFYNSFESAVLDVPARGVLSNDNDADTPPTAIAAVLVAGPSRAQAFTLNPDGSFSYTPESGFRGFDGFIYKANDGSNDSNLAMEVYAPERQDWVPVTELSRGTLDVVYLAARIGLVRLVTGDRRPPIILDDPFVTLDDARAARALELLRDLAADFQVIYLTTSDRYDALADAVVVLDGPTAADDHVEPEVVAPG